MFRTSGITRVSMFLMTSRPLRNGFMSLKVLSNRLMADLGINADVNHCGP